MLYASCKESVEAHLFCEAVRKGESSCSLQNIKSVIRQEAIRLFYPCGLEFAMGVPWLCCKLDKLMGCRAKQHDTCCA